MTPQLVYTAQSKQHFYCRDAVCEYVFKRGAVPLNPFRAFDYFLGDRVPREMVREGNQRLIAASDQLWVFGTTLADGVVVELAQATRLGIPVKFFTIGASVAEIHEVAPDRVDFELEVLELTGLRAPEMRAHVLCGQAETVVHALGRVGEVRDRV